MYDNHTQAKMQSDTQGIAKIQAYGGGGGGSSGCYNQPTVEQVIDQRITTLTDEIDKLKRLKSTLAEPGGILKLSVNDLRMLTNF